MATEYLFWLVAFSFYVFDNIKLIPTDHLMVREKFMGGYCPLISFSGYEVAGKEIKMPNLFLPFSMIFILKCDPETPHNEKEIIRSSRLLKILSRDMFALRVISTFSFLTLLVGPVITHYSGLVFALSCVVPIHFVLLLCAILFLITRRKRLKLSKHKTLMLILESMLVPAYLSNMVRRVSISQNFSVDGYTFAMANASSTDLDGIKYQIGKKLDSLIDEYDDGQTSHMLYSSYKTNLGI